MISQEQYEGYLRRMAAAQATIRLEKRFRSRLEAKLERAEKLLSDAAWEFKSQLSAAGPDEERQNPHYKELRKLVQRIERFTR